MIFQTEDETLFTLRKRRRRKSTTKQRRMSADPHAAHLWTKHMEAPGLVQEMLPSPSSALSWATAALTWCTAKEATLGLICTTWEQTFISSKKPAIMKLKPPENALSEHEKYIFSFKDSLLWKEKINRLVPSCAALWWRDEGKLPGSRDFLLVVRRTLPGLEAWRIHYMLKSLELSRKNFLFVLNFAWQIQSSRAKLSSTGVHVPWKAMFASWLSVQRQGQAQCRFWRCSS